ncbi:MAG TPA: hypothetical protein VNV85_10840 [Puia sp.]|nr:hypothetical protein [Puia sp.]
MVRSRTKHFLSGIKIIWHFTGQVIFIDAKSQKEILWVLEEALKCEELAAALW